MERSYSTKCKTIWLIIKFLCKKSFKQKIFQRYKDMNLTDWDELNSIDLRIGLTTINYGPYYIDALCKDHATWSSEPYFQITIP